MLDEVGRSDFNRLQNRPRRRRWYEGADPVVFCAFDLLVRSGRKLMDQPVEARKAQLAEVLRQRPLSVLYVGHIGGDRAASCSSTPRK